jgi:hypothetical protein
MVRLTAAIACLGFWVTSSASAQRLDTPRMLTVVIPHNINQQRCVEGASTALQVAGFVDLTTTGTELDRTVYGKAEATNALFRCSQTQRVIIFALATVHVGVDTRSVGEAVMALFSRSTGIELKP